MPIASSVSSHFHTNEGATARGQLHCSSRIERGLAGTPELRVARKEEFEPEQEIVVSHGEFNYWLQNQVVFDRRAYFLMSIGCEK